jgi:hypothetical protein
MEIIINNNNNELHPCQYCEKTCRGKQCKECHLKMVESKQGNCIDCDKTFYALRSNGSKRRRCIDCQTTYNQKHISQCPICKNDYHAFLEDGRVFDKCYTCYQNSLIECKNCDKKISNNQPLCKNCYQEQKQYKVKLLSMDDNISDGYENTYKNYERTCRTKNCQNITTYTFCRDCYLKNKQLTDDNISICEICNYKGPGNFKICNNCN